MSKRKAENIVETFQHSLPRLLSFSLAAVCLSSAWFFGQDSVWVAELLVRKLLDFTTEHYCISIALLSFAAFVSALYISVFWKPAQNWKKLDPEFERRRAIPYPPPFPNGWYKLCDTDEICIGDVKEVSALGELFAVFRGEDGHIGVLNAYCPHLGANLACGKVKGSSLECPFHAWKFNKDGKCVDIPYAKKISKTAVTRSWHVVEKWNCVLVWYHCDDEEPSWFVENLPEIDNKEFSFRHKINGLAEMHIQDFAENGPDFQHFSPVHGKMTIPWVNYFVKVKHQTNWRTGEQDKKHMGYFTNDVELVSKWSDKVIPDAGAKASADLHGPSLFVFRFKTRFGTVLLLKTLTPLSPLKQRMEDRVYASKGMWNILAKYIVVEANTQFADDIRIWRRKTYQNKPMIIREDGPIMSLRRWYKQFYSKNSRRGREDLSW